MLTVGFETARSSDSSQLASFDQTFTLSCFLIVASSIRFAASATIAFSAAEIGRALSAKPSMAGSAPSGVTSVESAWTRWKEGLSTRGRLLGVDVLARPAAPLLAARDELALDDALGARG